MAIDAQQLWADKYAARYAEAKFREDEAREAAFGDAEIHRVCGEPLRPMAPRDLLILQAIGSPLVYAGQEVTPAHVLQFLWALHAENRGHWLRRAYHRARMIRRVAHTRRSADPVGDAILEVCAYIGTMYLDAPAAAASGEGGERISRPLGACWIAPAMVRIAADLGPRDPFDGRPWGEVPMPRLWQYLKAIRARDLGDKFKDYSPSDRVMSEWLAESQQPQPAPAPTTP